MTTDIFLLNISGQDKPGLTASLTGVLAQYGAKILDIGQANIHDTLSLGILFEITSGEQSSAVQKDLLFKAYELGITAKFKAISLKDCIRGMTIWPAVGSFAENERGSLEQGKEATFVVLDKPISAEKEFIENFALLTVIRGEKVLNQL